MGLDRVTDLEPDEWDALWEAVRDHYRDEAWTNVNEVLCAVVEALWAVQGRLEAGIPVVMVKQTGKPNDPGRYPRPSWVKAARKADDDAAQPAEDDDGIPVIRDIRQAIRVMRGEVRL